MGKGSRKPQEEEEVLGQIFDFIFKEAKKPVEKRKPIKMGGKIANSELADALAAALEKPGLFVTDQMLQTMNDALNIEFGRLNADEKGDSSAKFTTTSLVDFIKNPNKFLDKPLQDARAARKAGRLHAFGKAMENLAAVGWAQNYNLDLDTKKAIMGHYEAERAGKEAEASRAFGTLNTKSAGINPSEMNYTAPRSADLVGREMFGRNGWELMSDDRKRNFQIALQKGDKVLESYIKVTYAGSNPKFSNMALARYAALKQDAKNNIDEDGNKHSVNISLFDLDSYNFLEERNLKGRMQDMQTYLKAHPNLSVKEKENIENGIEKLGQAYVVVSGQHASPENVRRRKVEINRKIYDYQAELAAARKAGDKDKIEYYQSGIKGLRKGSRALNAQQFWGNIGKAEGIVGSWNGIYANGNAIVSVLNGKFFDPEQNSLFCPSKKTALGMGSHSIRKMDSSGNWKEDSSDERVGILVAEDGNNALTTSYNNVMTTLYYFTPKSLMKTFFVNGEGFAYLSYLKEASLAKELGISSILGKDEHLNLGLLFKDDPDYINKLIKKGIKPGDIAKLKSGLKVPGKLAQFFSFGQRQRDKIKEWMNERVYKKMRSGIYKFLIGRVKGADAIATLEQWFAKGGIQVLAKALTSALLKALIIDATAGLGAFLAPLISGIISDLLYNSAKVLIQVAMLVLAGIVGIAFFLISPSSVDNFDSQTYAYTNVVPGEVYNNINYLDEDYIISGGDPGAPGTIYTGDIEEIYNQVREEMGLDTTLTLVTCTDGQDANETACAYIDWAWCYSGTTIYCKVDKLALASDAGLTNLFRHELTHQIQGGGGQKMREWGADYVSNNGGGYKFNTPAGVKRATETASYFLSSGVCSAQQLRDVALTKYDALASPCGALVNSYIKSIYTN